MSVYSRKQHYRRILLGIGSVGFVLITVSGQQLFAADTPSRAEMQQYVQNCNTSVAETVGYIASDWSTEPSAIIALNTSLDTSYRCIRTIEDQYGVSATTQWRTDIQDAIGVYMQTPETQHTSVTWVLDGYSATLTESLIAESL